MCTSGTPCLHGQIVSKGTFSLKRPETLSSLSLVSSFLPSCYEGRYQSPRPWLDLRKKPLPCSLSQSPRPCPSAVMLERSKAPSPRAGGGDSSLWPWVEESGVFGVHGTPVSSQQSASCWPGKHYLFPGKALSAAETEAPLSQRRKPGWTLGFSICSGKKPAPFSPPTLPPKQGGNLPLFCV